MGNHGYKKYMKQNVKNDNPFFKIFLITFCITLLFCTFIIKSFSPTVDTSIGDYQDSSLELEQDEVKKIDNNRLEMIQSEDQGKNFREIMQRNEQEESIQDFSYMPERTEPAVQLEDKTKAETKEQNPVKNEPVYKVFIGSYTSAEQAKVANDIIQDSGSGLNPIVKCIGSNNYTLQVGIFKNKKSAEALLYTIQQNHLPGRIVQDY